MAQPPRHTTHAAHDEPAAPAPAPVPAPTPVPAPAMPPADPDQAAQNHPVPAGVTGTTGGSEVPQDAQAQRELEAAEAALHPKDFKLAQPGSKDYVAGQPVDEKELGEVTAEAEKRLKSGHDPKTQGGTVHERTVSQYGPEGGAAGAAGAGTSTAHGATGATGPHGKSEAV